MSQSVQPNASCDWIHFGFLNENRSQSQHSSQPSDTIETLKSWNFNYGIFQKQRLGDVLRDIDQVFVEQGNFGTNENDKIPIIISHINFPFLKLLNLQTNHIKCIQIFQSLKMPEMKELILKNNHISSLRVFKKLNWTNLQAIDLQKNLVIDLHPMTFSGFKKLRKLLLETDKQSDQKVCQNLGNLVKLNTDELSYVKCPSQRRVVVDEQILVQVKNKFQRRAFVEIDNNQQLIHQNYRQLQIIHKRKKHHN